MPANQKNQPKIAGDALPVMEAFYTIQGEGYHQGKAAYFIRLGGCDVGCHWCDVKDSWDADIHPSRTLQQLSDEIPIASSKIIVCTGGEPLMYNLESFCMYFHQGGYMLHLETSGAYELTGKWDWICLSPKKFAPPKTTIFPYVNELKIIIYNKSDFDWAEEYASAMKDNCHLFLQPEWSKKNKLMPYIVDYVKSNPKWKISLQIHKFMDVP